MSQLFGLVYWWIGYSQERQYGENNWPHIVNVALKENTKTLETASGTI